MSEPGEPSVEQRLAALESAVARLENTLKSLIDSLARRERLRAEPLSGRLAARLGRRSAEPGAGTPGAAPVASVSPAARPVTAGSQRAAGPGDRVTTLSTDWLLNRVGIGLLLLGVAFLFKYSVDQGWLTPTFRIVFGVVLGAALAGIGLSVPSDRRWFAPVMLGGAAATWYITGFAAFQLFRLVSYPVAFGFMVAVTAFAFWSAMREDRPVLGVLGAAGGFGTPFLLYTDAGTVPALIAYAVLVLVGTSAIYARKGWLSVLWTSAAGAFGIMLVALNDVTSRDDIARFDRWALQIGVVLTWIACWMVPVVRAVARSAAPDRWPTPPRHRASRAWLPGISEDLDHVAALSVGAPLLTLAISLGIWDLADTVAGMVCLAGALVYGVASARLDRLGQPTLVAAHGVATTLFLTVAFGFLFDGHALFVAWAGLAAGIHVFAGWREDRALEVVAHLLFVLVGLWLMGRLVVEDPEGRAVLNIPTLADGVALVLAGAASRAMTRPDARRLYRLLAYVALLVLLWRELVRLPQGDAYVSIVWGALGLGLLFAGVRRDLADLRRVALATLGLVVAKLFLIDLAQLEAIWRIALFLGFGGLFLAVSYYFRQWWRKAP
jgi:uncharacterized membrane protein